MATTATEWTGRWRLVGAATCTRRRSRAIPTSSSPACGRDARRSPPSSPPPTARPPSTTSARSSTPSTSSPSRCRRPCRQSVAIAAARAGRHLILEKPLADSLDAAPAAGRRGGRGRRRQRRRADVPIRAGNATVARRHRRRGPWSGGNGRAGCPVRCCGGKYAGSAWRQRHGAILDIGPHVFDLLDAALGPIVDVRAAAASEPDLWHVICEHRERRGQHGHAVDATGDRSRRCSSSTSTATAVVDASRRARRRRSSASPRCSTSWRR